MKRQFASVIVRPRAAVQRLLGDVRGGTTIEYGLILAFMVLMMLVALTQMADVAQTMWSDISSRVTKAR